MAARDDYPFPAAVADGRVNGGAYGKQETAAALDEIDRLRAWQTDTIRWLCEKRLLMEINGGELCPVDEIYTPEGLDVIRKLQTVEVQRLRDAIAFIPVRVVSAADADPIEIAKCKGHNALRDQLQKVLS